MKLGPCILPGGGAGIRLVRAGATVAKLVDDFGLAAQIRRDHPGCLVVGRVTEPAELDPVNAYLADRSPEQAAEDFVNRQMGKYSLNPAIEVWEGANESGLSHGAATDPEVQRRMIWYASLEIWRLVLLKSLGLRGVVGNFSTGTPAIGLWAHFLPALESAVAHDGYLGLHEYGSVFMSWDVGADGKGWNTLRYRRVPQITASGVRVVITESGLDGHPQDQTPPGYTSGAWKTCAPQWLAHGDTTDADRFYSDQLIWHEKEMAKDPYVIGATTFCCGGTDTWKDHRFDDSAVLGHLEAYGLSQPEPPPLPEPPAPEPPAEPEPPADGDDGMADFTLIHAQLDTLKKLIPIARAQVKINLKIRDASGNDTGRVQLALRIDGSMNGPIDIYEKGITVGPNSSGQTYTDRAVIDRATRENVWGTEPDAVSYL